ncbi:scn1 [Candida oxycetoniae]|uniref:Scn1 n=1 Tax=Candida oxycetoniae TaxID=497107 RepID=A0AAI9STR3_9ASCO|nr:scn1 [Candida oxycetoniae]KAI3402881.2 scn1 [Candida oxycetoniae]
MEEKPLIDLSDSHCHFHPEATFEDAHKFAAILNNSNSSKYFFHLMTTQHIDLECMDILLENLKEKNLIVPYFGVHPWFSHLFYLGSEKPSKIDHYNSVLKPPPTKELLSQLPEPLSLLERFNRILELVAKYDLQKYGIGEIGLDKLFRVPKTGFLGNPNCKEEEKEQQLEKEQPEKEEKLSPSKVTLAHQKEIFRHQLDFANRVQKQVSIHCVKAHGALFDEVKKYPLLRVLLHSYTGSIDQAKLWIRTYPRDKLFFSFSNWINGEREESLKLLINELDARQILTESDIYVDKLFIQNKREEYLNHLLGIYQKLNQYIDFDSLQVKANMLTSINAI